MSVPDFSFIETGRNLEVEAVKGGRAQNEFSFAPQSNGEDEEQSILLRPVDDAKETDELLHLIPGFVAHSQQAFRERGLTYPFIASTSGDGLVVLPGSEPLAKRAAELSGMMRQGNPIAKNFEEAAFRALHSSLGGWGVCVGSPRRSGQGAEAAIRGFRSSLLGHETGELWPSDFARNGDHGADGFIILGRTWGGPIVFYQAKNTNLDVQSHPEEFARSSDILLDWFGKRWDQHRIVLPVLASNTVLTLTGKDELGLMRGAQKIHIIDAVDILWAEFATSQTGVHPPSCTFM